MNLNADNFAQLGMVGMPGGTPGTTSARGNEGVVLSLNSSRISGL